MDWQDDGIVLSLRRHGEGNAIVSLLTAGHGRHAGLVRGGAGRRLRPQFEPGNLVEASWKARLPEHLGTYTCELKDALAARCLSAPGPLAALNAACAVVDKALPEREPVPDVFAALLILLNGLAGLEEGRAGADAAEGGAVARDEDRAGANRMPSLVWARAYIAWEINLLAELGFGLDLTCCAATGEVEDLVYVSPRSGRAVSRGAGAPYKGRLLDLPAFLITPHTDAGAKKGAHPEADEVAKGLALSGYFLARHVFNGPSGVPSARTQLQARLAAEKTPATHDMY